MANEKLLIDADMLMERFRIVAQSGGAVVYHVSDICAAIEDAATEETVDAVEVVHGRWVKKTEDYVYYYACSECGEPVLKSQWGHDFFSDYCPNCGAKMDGGNDV